MQAWFRCPYFIVAATRFICLLYQARYSLLFPLNGSRRLGSKIVKYSVDAGYFGNDS